MSQYPFERFSEHARRALFCAQQEAEDANVAHIGTEHLLLGLFRVGAGSGWRALRALGVDELKVRAEIDRLHGNRQTLANPWPTNGTKRAVEGAFQQSSRRGDTVVHTGDLLAGIVQVADGTAAHVLQKLWFERSTVVAAADREIQRG